MGEVENRKVLEEYKNVYMPYRNFAERTRVEYLNDLEDFVDFLEKSGIHHPKNLGLPIIERFVAQLENKGYASLTRKRKVVTIRSFLTFLYQDGYIKTNIANRIVLPYTENKAPYFLTRAEIDRVRNAYADRPRDRAIIELLLQTGIKLSELVNLKIDDIELEKIGDSGKKHSGYVRIIGRRGKERLIPLNTQAFYALKNYIRTRKRTDRTHLFLNRFCESIGERGVQKVLKKYFKKARVRDASVHTLRHTFGVRQISSGASTKYLQETMGLKDRRSVAIYTELAKAPTNSKIYENPL